MSFLEEYGPFLKGATLKGTLGVSSYEGTVSTVVPSLTAVAAGAVAPEPLDLKEFEGLVKTKPGLHFLVRDDEVILGPEQLRGVHDAVADGVAAIKAALATKSDDWSAPLTLLGGRVVNSRQGLDALSIGLLAYMHHPDPKLKWPMRRALMVPDKTELLRDLEIWSSELQKDLDAYLPDSLLGLNLDTKPRPNLLKTYKEFWTDEGLPSVRAQFEGVARKVAESP